MNGTINGGNAAKSEHSAETTGINSSTALLNNFSFSEFLTEEAYMSNDSLPMPCKRKYTYSVF